MIFLDEPYLSSVGSGFSPIQRDDVVTMLKEVINYLRERSDALIGIHCCGNTDWSMVIEAEPNIINFDAFDYMDHFLLYRKEIVRFLKMGGILAWGVVPTTNLSEDQSVDTLLLILENGLRRIGEWGIDRDMLAERSILTPVCGMGTMTPELARKGMDLLYRLFINVGQTKRLPIDESYKNTSGKGLFSDCRGRGYRSACLCCKGVAR
jgi:methionine synthase II (cobalamin-independent)